MTDDTRDVIDAVVSDYLRTVETLGGKPLAVGIRRRIIAALDAKGLGIRPREPTHAMLNAAENIDPAENPASLIEIWKAQFDAEGGR